VRGGRGVEATDCLLPGGSLQCSHSVAATLAHPSSNISQDFTSLLAGHPQRAQRRISADSKRRGATTTRAFVASARCQVHTRTQSGLSNENVLVITNTSHTAIDFWSLDTHIGSQSHWKTIMMETKSEDLHLQAFDKFVANAIMKTGYGLGVGLLFSVTLFRRRWFPIHLGTGTGFGFALSDYNKHLKSIK
jgi:hypothetical protein